MFQKIKDLFRIGMLGAVSRSSKWPKVRAEFIKLYPTCEVCGGNKKIEVHHMAPFHIYPELELEPSNLITLCESKNNGVNCHLFFGHLGNFKKYNPTVVNDSKTWKLKILNRN